VLFTLPLLNDERASMRGSLLRFKCIKPAQASRHISLAMR